MVGAVYLVLQAVFVSPHLGYSTDEVDYLAKVDPSVPELYWSPVRAWGTPLLATPVAVFAPGVVAVRVWFGVLSSVGLVGAFWPWLRALRPTVAPLAALLFATIWFATYYGRQVMPNLWVALGAVATAGMFVRAAQSPRWWRSVGVGAAAAFVALVRPTDSLLLVAPLAVCGVVVRRLRRFDLLAALVVGAAVGWLPWVVEAYLRFGGPLARWRSGGEAGLGGLHLNLATIAVYPRLFDGRPSYCCYGRPLSTAGQLPLAGTLWYAAVPVLAAIGVAAAARWRRLPEIAAAVLPAATLAGFYLLLLDYGSVRFLLPVYALLSLPVAAALVLVATSIPGRGRPAGLVVVAALLVGHLGLQLVSDARINRFREHQLSGDVQVADAVRPLVPARPCLLIAQYPAVLSYYLKCHPQGLHPSRRPPASVRRAIRQRWTVIAVARGRLPGRSFIRSWRTVPLRTAGQHGWSAYLPPP